MKQSLGYQLPSSQNVYSGRSGWFSQSAGAYRHILLVESQPIPASASPYTAAPLAFSPPQQGTRQLVAGRLRARDGPAAAQ